MVYIFIFSSEIWSPNMALKKTPGLLATDIHIQIQIILPRELSETLWM